MKINRETRQGMADLGLPYRIERPSQLSASIRNVPRDEYLVVATIYGEDDSDVYIGYHAVAEDAYEIAGRLNRSRKFGSVEAFVITRPKDEA